MKNRTVSLWIFGLLMLPGTALAAWGENWGEMSWGLPVFVPSVQGIGLIVLALSLSATAAWRLRKRRSALGLPVLLVLLAIPLVVVAGTVSVPNTFVNSTVADADEVNANFNSVETAVNDNDSRITAVDNDAAAAQSTADTAVTDAAAAQATADAAQVRVWQYCMAGSSIRAIAADGTVTCEVDTDSDTNTTYSAGSGLSLLGTTFAVDSALSVDGGTIENTPIGQTGAAPINASTLTVDGTAGVNGGTLSLDNGTSNLVDFGNNGVAAPAEASAGWKLRLYDGAGVNQDYGLGIESNTLWLASNSQFKFYIEDASPGGTYVNHMTLGETGMDVAGDLDVAEDITFGPEGTSLTAALASLGGATGLEACSDGLTVADHDTGLLWEKKTGTPVDYASRVFCESAGCPDPHDVANAYEWSNVAPDPNGNAFTDFLAKLNDSSQPATWSSSSSGSIGTQTSGCFADHCNWRLPNIVEFQTIRNCGFGDPCIDPVFGPTASSFYWSASSFAAGSPDIAWWLTFADLGTTGANNKANDHFVRAVRAGSCEH